MIKYPYICIEGIAGVGKSTQIKKLKEWFIENGITKEIIITREPGGTEISEDIRTIVQGKDYDEIMEHETEAYLYAASRAQSLRKIVAPVINKGGIVLADRSVVSSLVYQAYARKLGVKKVWEINKHAVGKWTPNILIILDLPAEIAKKRMLDQDGDKWEKMDLAFYKKVRNWYVDIAKNYSILPKTKRIIINANGTPDEVYQRLINRLGAFYK